MTLRNYLTVMSLGTILAWTSTGLVLTMTDPTEASAAVIGVLYFALFLSFVGTFSLFGFILRVWLMRQQYYISRQVLIAFRQAILFSLLLTVALVLQSKGLLTWWNSILVVAALTTLEFFFITAKVKT